MFLWSPLCMAAWFARLVLPACKLLLLLGVTVIWLVTVTCANVRMKKKKKEKEDRELFFAQSIYIFSNSPVIVGLLLCC